tara:strand:+ start:240 stop:347 length:108 start_codon:yes stop_codon:yes gene_type:complete
MSKLILTRHGRVAPLYAYYEDGMVKEIALEIIKEE